MSAGAKRVVELLERCIGARAELMDPEHGSAFRLFNGFTEGFPALVLDIYASTLLIANYADPAQDAEEWLPAAQQLVQDRLPWLRAGVLKHRNGPSEAEKRGSLVFGDQLDTRIREHGVSYAVDLLMHQDAGLYLDTRNLRRWVLDHLQGRTALNAFAYTGSLGVAALVGGAQRVVQLDRNARYLASARASYALNHLAIRKPDFIHGDFFQQVGRLKNTGTRFDCVILDPPFFSASPKGVVDQANESARLINKVRPLVNHGGLLIAVNNAVYVSGTDYMRTLEALCADGYLRIAELIPVPEDFTGYPGTRMGDPITDPAPFNHSTKIAVLEVRRKEP